MESTQAELDISFEEAQIDFDCEVKNLADIKHHPALLTSVFNDEQVTAESDSAHENMISCLKDFDTILDNVREKNSHINTSTSNIEEEQIAGPSLETCWKCDGIDHASANVEIWKNIYENFARANEFKNVYIGNTDNGQDEYKTYLRNEIQTVNERDEEIKFPKNLHEHKAQIFETKQNYNNVNTKIIEHNYNDFTKIYFENDTKIQQNKLHINGGYICKIPPCKSKQINEITNLDTRKVESKSYNNRSEISISFDDENLRENAKTLKNDTRNIISISSDESVEKIEFDSEGYNSSDFEFINEIEAMKDMPAIHNFVELFDNNSDDKVQTANIKELFPEDMIINDYFELLYPIPTNEFDESYRENHTIPLGEDYFNLFGGNHTPYPMYSFENKSTRSSAGMNVESGVGFDMNMFRDDSTPEQRSEAKESEQKILSMYYVENGNRRQRRR